MIKGFLDKPNSHKSGSKGSSPHGDNGCMLHKEFNEMVMAGPGPTMELKVGYNLNMLAIMLKDGMTKPDTSLFGFGTLITEDDLKYVIDMTPSIFDKAAKGCEDDYTFHENMYSTFLEAFPFRGITVNTPKFKELIKLLSKRLPESALLFSYKCPLSAFCNTVHKIEPISERSARAKPMEEKVKPPEPESKTKTKKPETKAKKKSPKNNSKPCAGAIKYAKFLYDRKGIDNVKKQVGHNLIIMGVVSALNAKIDAKLLLGPKTHVGNILVEYGCSELLGYLFKDAPRILQHIMFLTTAANFMFKENSDLFSAAYDSFLDAIPADQKSRKFKGIMKILSKPISVDLLSFSYDCPKCRTEHQMSPDVLTSLKDEPPQFDFTAFGFVPYGDRNCPCCAMEQDKEARMSAQRKTNKKKEQADIIASPSFQCPPSANPDCDACAEVSFFKMMLVAREHICESDLELMLGYNRILLGCISKAQMDSKRSKNSMFAQYLQTVLSIKSRNWGDEPDILVMTGLDACVSLGRVNVHQGVFNLQEINALARRTYEDWVTTVTAAFKLKITSRKFKELVKTYPKPTKDQLAPKQKCLKCHSQYSLDEGSQRAQKMPKEFPIVHLGNPDCEDCYTLTLVQMFLGAREFVDQKDFKLMFAYNAIIVTCFDFIDIDTFGGIPSQESQFIKHPSVKHIEDLMDDIHIACLNCLGDRLMDNWGDEREAIVLSANEMNELALRVLSATTNLFSEMNVEVNCSKFDELLKIFPKPTAADIGFPYTCNSCEFVHKYPKIMKPKPKARKKKKVKTSSTETSTNLEKATKTGEHNTTSMEKDAQQREAKQNAQAELSEHLREITAANSILDKECGNLKSDKEALKDKLKTFNITELGLRNERNELEESLKAKERVKIDNLMENDVIAKKIDEIAGIEFKKAQKTCDLQLKSLEQKLQKVEMDAKNKEESLKLEKDSHDSMKKEFEALMNSTKILHENNVKKFQDLISKEKQDKDAIEIGLVALKNECENLKSQLLETEQNHCFAKRELKRTNNAKEANIKHKDTIQLLESQFSSCNMRAINSKKTVIDLTINLKRIQMQTAVKDLDHALSDIDAQILKLDSQNVDYVYELKNHSEEYKQCKSAIERSFENIVLQANAMKKSIESGKELDELEPVTELVIPNLSPFPNPPPIVNQIQTNDCAGPAESMNDLPSSSGSVGSYLPMNLPPRLQKKKLQPPLTQIQPTFYPVVPTPPNNAVLKRALVHAISIKQLHLDYNILQTSLKLVDTMRQSNPTMTDQAVLVNCLNMYETSVQGTIVARMIPPPFKDDDDKPVVPVAVKPADMKEDDQCAICWEPVMNSPDPCTCSNCNYSYFYHLACLELHLKKSANSLCPTCQKRMISDQQFPALG